jgi:hypothetical protein
MLAAALEAEVRRRRFSLADPAAVVSHVPEEVLALEQLLGSSAGLSPATVNNPSPRSGRPITLHPWTASCSVADYVYMWAHGISFNVRPGGGQSLRPGAHRDPLDGSRLSAGSVRRPERQRRGQ